MGNRRPEPHWLARNDKVWTPPAVIYWDTETVQWEHGEDWLQTLRCWAAQLDVRRPDRHNPPAELAETGTDADHLAKWFDAATTNRRTTWAYAHNQQFDLVVTRLPQRLVDLGWELSDFSLNPQSAWLRLSKGHRRLTMVDSWSVLPRALATLGKQLGLVKPDLPDQADDLDDWLARCEADVSILAGAVGQLMDWWDRGELGNWSITGSSCGWHAMRHRIHHPSIRVDPDPERAAEDRRAIHGGRRDGTRVGVWHEHLFAHLDFTAAYPTIARELPLPRRRMGAFGSLPVDHDWVDSDRFGIMARVELDTDQPRYPLRLGQFTYYPVGRFQTVLCSPEIAWARGNGDLVAIGPGRMHQLGRPLSPWADWVLAVQDGVWPDSPPMARVAAKLWGRSVLGRFASRGRTTEHVGPAWVPGWRYRKGWSHPAECPLAVVDLLGEQYLVRSDQETENGYPAIFAWVESATRARLGKLVELLGEDVWVYADTDGVMIDMQAAAGKFWNKGRGQKSGPPLIRLAEGLAADLAKHTAPLVPRVKDWSHNLELWGPQHVITDTERRLSGVRRDAERTGARTFAGHNWPGLTWQASHGDTRGYVNPKQVWRVSGTTLHRWVDADGHGWPPEARISPAGVSELVPWAESSLARLGVELAPDQAHALARLL